MEALNARKRYSHLLLEGPFDASFDLQVDRDEAKNFLLLEDLFIDRSIIMLVEFRQKELSSS